MVFCEQFLVDPIAEYANLYPKVVVDLDFNDKRVHLIEEGYDLVIRIEALKASGLTAKKLCDQNLYFCASQEFIEKHGPLLESDNLIALPFLDYSSASSGLSLSYKSPDGSQRSHNVKPAIHANSLAMLMESTLQGLARQPIDIR